MLDRRLHTSLARTGKIVADFLLPPRCPACATRVLEHGTLCAGCWSELAMITAPFCAQCGLPFQVTADEGALCGGCIKSPPDFEWARAAVAYEGLGRDMVLKLKHGSMGAAVPLLGALMASAMPDGKAVDMIVPVPLHRWRLLKRRFNQSQLLAKAIGKRLDRPVAPFVLERHRATPSQGTLGRKQRDSNVRGAFRVNEAKGQTLAGKSILLVDDVLTTGATASACARALRKAGASEVGLLVFARVGRAE